MWPRGGPHSRTPRETMDLRTPYRGVLLLALSLSLVSSAAWADKTLWLVRPLYPGQEALVDRTEKALDKLMPGEARQDAVIGQKELAGTLKAQVITEVPCFSADSRCACSEVSCSRSRSTVGRLLSISSSRCPRS